MEGDASRSLNGSSFLAAYNYWPDQCSTEPIRCPLNNRAGSWSGWTSNLRQVATATNTCIQADPWTTSSGATGLEYFAFIGRAGTQTNCIDKSPCLAIAATSASNLVNNTWTYPATCINSGTGSDGPAIHFDKGASNLFAVERAGAGARLYIMRNCGAGQPGGTSCPVTSNIQVLSSALDGHPNVVVNPCTHNAVVAYREFTSGTVGRIRVRFYSSTGSLVNTYDVATNEDFSRETSCAGGGSCPSNQVGYGCKCKGANNTDCTFGSGNVCNRIAARVQMDTTYDGPTNKCYLYLTWPQSCQTAGGANRLKGRLSVIDITSETSPSSQSSWLSVGCASSTSDFTPAVSVSNWSSNSGAYIGWSVHRQTNGDACATERRMYLSTSITGAFGSWTNAQVSSGTYPTIIGGNITMGDYDDHVLGGEPSGVDEGWTHAVWSQSSAVSTGCHSCDGTQYAIRVMGARARP